MAASFGGIVALQTKDVYFGIQARVTLPQKYYVKGPAKHNYFDAYLGFANPFADDDPRAEAGIFKYGDRHGWTYFLWALGAAGWSERDVPTPAQCHMKLIFAHNDPTRVCFLVNGSLLWTNSLGRPISRGTYDKGGLQVKACLGMDDEKKTVYFERMQMSDIQVCTDTAGAKWVPITSVAYRTVIKNPAPTADSWYPLIASYKSNRM